MPDAGRNHQVLRYTLAITSCARHDLLKKTLTSFVGSTSVNPWETLIYEDSETPRPAWLDDFGVRLGKIKWLSDGVRHGQAYAIDRLYSEITDELVFHCEDDWEFHESGFLNHSFSIIRNHPDISMVALRSDWNHPLIPDPKGRDFEIAKPYWEGVWGGTSWNPGLRRLSDFRRFGNYGRHVGYGTNGLGHEARWSKLHLDAGYRIACLPKYARHIGDQRSRSCEVVPVALPRILIAVPACQQLSYGGWESENSPSFDRSKAYRGEAYGKDIHISGPNPRLDAVRATWWKDVEAHSNVDAKFFYGQPYVGTPAADEVVLDTGNDYASLPLRTAAICRYAVERNYDFVFKCDDDTAVYVDRLVTEIVTQRPGYGGCCHEMVATGGPGYILNKNNARIVGACHTTTEWAEDWFVSRTLGRRDIYPTNLPGHIPGYGAHWYWPNGYDGMKLAPDTVSVHAVQPDVMRAWYADIDGSYWKDTLRI